MVRMKGDDPILADNTLEEHQIAKDFVTVVYFAEQMFTETCPSSSVAQWDEIFGNNTHCGRNVNVLRNTFNKLPVFLCRCA